MSLTIVLIRQRVKDSRVPGAHSLVEILVLGHIHILRAFVLRNIYIGICKYYILKSLSRLTDPVIRHIIKENSARCIEQETANYARKRFFVRFICYQRSVSEQPSLLALYRATRTINGSIEIT